MMLEVKPALLKSTKSTSSDVRSIANKADARDLCPRPGAFLHFRPNSSVTMRFSALLVSFVSLFFFSVGAAPTDAGTDSLGGLTVGAIINALGVGLVTHINAIITLDSLTTNQISVNFDAKNPLFIELTIDRVVSSAGLNGTVYATFDHTFAGGVVLPPFGTKNSGTFGNVTLTQGIDASLGIIPFQVLDLTTDVYIRAGTINGFLGVPITAQGLKQSGVPTNYTLVLS
ncbi:hypothetical protein LshimejAT787_1401670 [Lyophyllum shimeji]|uniref:Uncharacterized protein n=1 Tax=Lyophyllum shimeji TaxID=47721 RepID=A0A9P3PX71_LYOSH|nr:hypothetical protein LshimejAT787_1401670 [Lyophyllum shimeji]